MLRDAAAGSGELAIQEAPHPADGLVEVAKERDASFLVVGNHGPSSSLLGSISADVSRRAPCPVIVVPPTAEDSGSEAGSDEPEVEDEPEGEDEPEVEGGILRFRVGSSLRRVA